MDELRRSSGGGEPADPPLDDGADVWFVWCCGVGDETFIGVNGAEVEDLLESVGEIGGETVNAELTGIEDKYSVGDLVDICWKCGGRWAAEIFAKSVWNEAAEAALCEYIPPTLGWCASIWGGGVRCKWLK